MKEINLKILILILVLVLVSGFLLHFDLFLVPIFEITRKRCNMVETTYVFCGGGTLTVVEV
jgi:hypothetical protein